MRQFLFAVSACITTLFPLPSGAALGAAKTIECGPGEYVVGLTGRAGQWIDAVGPVCARWNDRSFRTSAGRAKRPSGGSGGTPQQQTCPPGSAIGSWKVESIVQGDSGFANTVWFHCQTLAPPNEASGSDVRFGGRNKLPRGRRVAYDRECPAGRLVTGISVWTTSDGRFVTEVDMRCGEAPFVISAMTWQKQPNGTIRYSLPTLEMSTGGHIQVDWCREWATNCGAPAANAFCATKGAQRAISFDPKPKVGLTVIISDKRVCNAPTCQGFANIVCGPA